MYHRELTKSAQAVCVQASIVTPLSFVTFALPVLSDTRGRRRQQGPLLATVRLEANEDYDNGMAV
jgi:hypothetical protein